MRLRQQLEPRIGQCVHGHQVTGLQQSHVRCGQSVPGSIHEHHLARRHSEAPHGKMAGHCCPLVRAPTVWLVTQERFQIARGGELAQGCAQRPRLVWQSGGVEVQIHHVCCSRVLVDTQALGQGGFSDECAAPGLAADQSHGPKLRINAGRRNEGQTFPRRELPVGRQAGTRWQATVANVSCERVNQLFVAGVGHASMYP